MLQGLSVLEVGGIGPAPFAGMLLADLGADVIRVDRHAGEELFAAAPSLDLLNRGKRSILLDLKHRKGREAVLKLAASSDVLIEGFRPGVAERLGFGPSEVHAVNPSLVYGRMTGWGQEGPLSQRPGHDINYLGLVGALAAIGPTDRPPPPPLNLIGDLAGGALYLVVGLLAGLRAVQRGEPGTIVDAAIVDGAAHMMVSAAALANVGMWSSERHHNLLDGGAPFYRTYRTSDNRFVSVGAIEPKFFKNLVAALGIEFDPALQYDRASWPRLAGVFETAFSERSRSAWTQHFEKVDACVFPVFDMWEAAAEPHLAARGVFEDVLGQPVARSSPRFHGVEARRSEPISPGRQTREILEAVGLNASEMLADRAAFDQPASGGTREPTTKKEENHDVHRP